MKAFSLEGGGGLGTRKQKVAQLLNRFQFIDLAEAVTQPRQNRKAWLNTYLERKGGKFPSYRYFRSAIPTIYGVQRGLDPSPVVGRGEIERYVRESATPEDEARNVEAALALFDLVRPQNYTAYDHEERTLPLGRSRSATIGLKVELVRGEDLLFQYPYPRTKRLDDHTIVVLLSVLHHAYAVGDREGASIELADLSFDFETTESRREKLPRVRAPRIVRLLPRDLISLDDLTSEVQNVHDLLLELGDEPI